MIPTYNQEKYIEKCIESALSISYPNLEVVLSDDCSTDNTFSIAQKYEKDPRFKAYRNKVNLGRVKNYNNSLYNLVTGDWVLNCDGDDFLIDSDFYSKSMEMAGTNSDIVLFTANRYKFKNNKNNIQKSNNTEGLINGTNYFLNYPSCDKGLFHITSLYRRDLALKSNFYSLDIISSDVDSLLKMITNGDIYHFDNVIAAWRDHDENVSKSIDVKSRVDNLKLISDVYNHHLENRSLDSSKLKKWKNKFFINRIVRTGNVFLVNLQYINFFKYIFQCFSEAKLMTLAALLNYRLVLTFYFPYRVKLRSLFKK